MYLKVIIRGFLIFLFTSVKGYTQNSVKGQVVEFDKKKGVTYVNIMILNKRDGTTSNKNGQFRLPTNPNDTIIFSHINYHTAKIPFNDFVRNPIVFLKPKVLPLDEITINSSLEKKKKFRLNKFKKNKVSVIYSPKPFKNIGPWIPFREKEPSIETVFFPYKEDYGKHPKLNEIVIGIKSYKDESQFRLRIFKSENGMPGEDLPIKNSIIKVDYKTITTNVSMKEENIYMPESGIFIGVEHLIIPENLTTIKNEKNNLTASLYSPFLKYTRVRNDYYYYIYTKGSWEKVLKEAPNYLSGEQKYGSYKPAISVIIN